jgi:hypothetical protein
MKLFALHEGFYDGVQNRIDLLADTCKARGIEFVCIDSLTFDYTNIPKLTKLDLLYNMARGSTALEGLLLNDCVTTFYVKNPIFKPVADWSIVHEKSGLCAPKTIHSITSDRGLLRKYVDYLGGFPIILKERFGTRGIGTIKVESWHNLISTVDYLIADRRDFVMREYIQAEYGARVIVLGQEVIWSAKFYFQADDFRNAPLPVEGVYESLEVDKETRKMCIGAVHAANLEMAGVDVLFDRDGKSYLLEINFPTGFASFKHHPECVLPKMLDHLIEKARLGN